MSGLSRPAAAKMSITPSDATAREMICRTARSKILLGAGFSRCPLRQRRPHRLEESHIVTDAHCLRVRHGQGKGL